MKERWRVITDRGLPHDTVAVMSDKGETALAVFIGGGSFLLPPGHNWIYYKSHSQRDSSKGFRVTINW